MNSSVHGSGSRRGGGSSSCGRRGSMQQLYAGFFISRSVWKNCPDLARGNRAVAQVGERPKAYLSRVRVLAAPPAGRHASKGNVVVAEVVAGRGLLLRLRVGLGILRLDCEAEELAFLAFLDPRRDPVIHAVHIQAATVWREVFG